MAGDATHAAGAGGTGGPVQKRARAAGDITAYIIGGDFNLDHVAIQDITATHGLQRAQRERCAVQCRCAQQLQLQLQVAAARLRRSSACQHAVAKL